MKLKAMVVESAKLKPLPIFITAMHRLHEKCGYEEAQAMIYGVALQVAKECDCFFDLDGDSDQNKEVFYFWSRELGEDRPNPFTVNE